MIVLSDIDSTLADIRHRVSLTRSSQIDWQEVSAALAFDRPIKPVIYLLQLCAYRGDLIHLMSGRSVETHAATVAWLDKYNVPWHSLKMRGSGDYRPNWELKQGWLRDYPRQLIRFALDDDPFVCKMLSRFNVLPLQVGQPLDSSQHMRTGNGGRDEQGA